MALYSISYTRPGEGVFAHELEAKSDTEARMRFLNLSWVAFTSISINSVALKGDQPEEAKKAANRATDQERSPAKVEMSQPFSSPPNKQRPLSGAAVRAAADRAEAGPKPRSARPVRATSRAVARATNPKPPTHARIKAIAAGIGGLDWQAEVARLTEEIGDLADKAQALTRAGKHDNADALRAKAKQLAATRAEITKRNKKK